MKTGSALGIAKSLTKTLYGRALVVLLLISFLTPQPFLIAAQETTENQSDSESAAASENFSEESQSIEGAEIELAPEDGEQMMSLLGSEETSATVDVPGLFSYKPNLPEVDRSTGALTERINFAIPPGRDGLTPEVALSYNSQQLEDEIAGYGWSISIPSIERLNKTGSENLYIDNYFTSSLGGELTKTTGTNEYTHRFEDGRFIRYTFTNDTWIAYDKTGIRYTFGTTTAARQAATSSPSNIYVWMLEEIRDTNDNYIKFEYTKDGNQIYPSKITYTGHGSTDGVFEIDFTYETRPDQFTSYKPNFRIDTTKRLTEVRASLNDSWVQKYTLAYSSGVNGLRSLLASIQETGRDESANELSLPATTFGYSSSTPQYENHANPRILNHAHIAADVDGNGLPDRSLFWSNSDTSGTTRIINKNEYPLFSTTSSAIDSEFWSFYYDAGTGANQYPVLERGTRFFDLNGDGRTDIVHGFKEKSGAVSRTYFQNAASLSWTATSTPFATPIFACGITDTFRLPTGIFGDVNDDGFTDYVASSTACSVDRTYLGGGKKSWSVASSTTFAAIAQMSTSTTNTTDLRSSQLIDINGDGLDDWMYSRNGQVEFYLNTGTGWGDIDSRWTFATTTRHANGWDRGIRFIDMNGDKLPDFVRAYTMPSYTTKAPGVTDIEVGTYNYVYVNTGSGFATSSLTAPEYIFNAYATSTHWTGQVDFNELVDWNGDGLPDSAGKTSTSTATAIADVLVQTTHPTGGRTLVEHKFTAQMASSSPELAFPSLVVTKLTNQDNLGGNETILYSYEGGKIYFNENNIRDRRFAGFRKITKQDDLGYTDTYFHQGDTADTSNGESVDEFALIGKAYREDVRDLSGNTLKKTFYKWSTITSSGAIKTLATSTNIFWMLAVAGGGGGGASGSTGSSGHGVGSGGAGGYVERTATELVAGTYPVTIGSGGGTNTNGGNTSIGSAIAAIGGGAGRLGDGNNGGSGGGGGRSGGSGSPVSGGLGTSGQGYNGAGAGGSGSFVGGGGGSGGSASTGSDVGGPGTPSIISGASATRAAGGSGNTSTNGGANTGDGGGGDSIGTAGGTAGGSGGSGIAFIRFLKDNVQILDQTGASETTSSGETVLSWPSGGTFQFSPKAPTTTTAYYFTSLISESVQDWEGGGTHKDKAVEYVYATTTGNLLRQIERGEVTGSTDGTYTDTGSDSRTTVFTYSATTSANLTLPTSKTVLSHASTTVAQTRFYYDGQSLGSATKGNLTKEENWITGASYASSTKEYDIRGLVGTTTDPRGNKTTYAYDTFKLYPATTTNALGHVTTYSYDYTKGEPKFTKDANGSMKTTVFDPVGRVKQEWQSDITSPATLVMTKEYTYTDTFPSRTQTRSYLNASTTIDSYEYRDGLGRIVQERNQAEDSDTFSVKDHQYNSAGLPYKESLPYFASGSARSAATVNTALYSVNTYDALQRPKSITTAVGSTTFTYTPWQTRTTDGNGNLKDTIKDAHENLAQVVEYNNGSAYTTSYTYNELGNLTRITDALSNIRNFTYDGLGRRTNAEDLHASADATFGDWDYTYDVSGNLTSSTDPKGQIIDYTYDNLNRTLTENYTGAGGTEVTYAYDSCTNGKGRLCIATSTGAITSYTYNPLGSIAIETKVIGGQNYITSYTYDRQSNVTGITYPDGSEVAYTYNTAGLPEIVSYKPSGGSFDDIVMDFDYSPAGAVAFKALGNGTETTYTYDANELYRLKRIQTVQVDGIGGMMDDESALFLENLEIEGLVLGTTTGDVLEPPADATVGSGESDLSVSTTSPERIEATLADEAGLLSDDKNTDDEGQIDEIILEDKEIKTDLFIPSISLSEKAFGADQESTYQLQVSDGGSVKYSDENGYISFKPAALSWDSESIKLAEETSFSKESAGKYKFESVFGPGIALDVLGEDAALRKHVKIESFESLGSIPEGAEYLEISFDVDTDYDVPLGRKTGKYPLGSKSTMLTPEAWDSFNPRSVPQNPDTDEHAVRNHTDIDWEFEKQENGYTFTKYVPVEWLKEAQYPVYADVDISYASEYEFDTGSIAAVKLLKLDTDKFAVCWGDYADGTDEGECKVGSVSGSTISFGSASTFAADLTDPFLYWSACDATTDKIAVVYANDPNTDEGEVRAATVSGTTIGTWGTAQDISGTQDLEQFDCAGISTNKIAVSYNNEGNSDTGESVAISFSGTTATVGAINDWATTDYNPEYVSVTKLGTDKFLTCSNPQDDDTGVCFASTVSGTTITHGTAALFANNDLDTSTDVAYMANDQFALTYQDGPADLTYVRAGTVSSTTVSFGAAQAIDNDNLADPRIAQHDGTHALHVRSDNASTTGVVPFGASNYFSVNFGTSAVTLGSDETFRSPNINVNGENGLDIVRVNTDTFIVCYVDSSDSDDGKCVVGSKQSAGANSAPTEPTSLQVEDQTNPTNISDSTPEFDAIFNDSNATNTATHYRLQVSTSSAFTSTHWDTTQTSLASTTPVGMRIADISYAGTSLASSTTYYWRIKFWDNGGLEGAWSTTTSSFTLATSTAGNSAPTAPSSLQTESQTNPTDVSDSTPEFTAVYNDPDTGDTANKYRLQVATSSVFTNVFWDSGTTSMATTTVGSTSPSISYAGTALASSTTYYWRIKFVDVAGADGAWSTATSSFVLTTATSTQSISGILQDISYTYDAFGNITQITDHSDSGAGKTIVYGYDNVHRMTFASTTAASSTPFRYQYAYDALGNITGSKLNTSATTTYSYAGTNYANPHAATSIGGVTHTYDNAGNLTSDGTWSHVWDYRNRLSASGSGATSTYAYDHTTDRVSLTENGTTTIYANRYFDTDGISNTLSVFDPQGNLLASIGETGAASYIYPDHLGSTNVTADENGGLTQVLDYYPYGSERISSGGSATDRHYIGERRDESTNLNYLNARYYNSMKGNFISQDPVFVALGNPNEITRLTQQQQNLLLSDPQAMNSYSYARNNPVVNKDSSGLCFEPLSALACIYGAYTAATLAIDAYDVYQTNVKYGHVFSQEEKNATNFNAGLNAVLTFAVGPKLIKDGGKAAGVGLDSLTGTLDALDHYFGEQIYKKYNDNHSPNLKQITMQNGSQIPASGNGTNNAHSNGSRQGSGQNGSFSYNQLVSGLQSLVSSLKSYVSSLQASNNKKN